MVRVVRSDDSEHGAVVLFVAWCSIGSILRRDSARIPVSFALRPQILDVRQGRRYTSSEIGFLFFHGGALVDELS